MARDRNAERAAVIDAVQSLGVEANLDALSGYIQENHGLKLRSPTIRGIKSHLTPEQKRPAPVTPAKKTATVSHNGTGELAGGININDARAIKKLCGRMPNAKLKEWIDVLSK